MQRAFYATDLPPTARFVALTLAWHHNAETDRCDPSVMLIANETGLCERSVRSALKTISEAGHMTVVQRPGSTPMYQLHPVTPASPAPQPCISCTPATDAPLHLLHHPPATDAPPPLQEMHPTPASPAPKLERTGRGTSNEQESAPALPASPPETVPAQTLSLFSDEPALTPKPKPRKPKPPAEFQPPKDPRHHEITREIKAIYEQHARMPYVNSPRFYKRLQVFLSQWHGDSELFLSVYAKALTFADQEFASKEIRLASDPTYLCDNFQKVVAAVDWMQASIDRNSKPKTFTKGI